MNVMPRCGDNCGDKDGDIDWWIDWLNWLIEWPKGGFECWLNYDWRIHNQVQSIQTANPFLSAKWKMELLLFSARICFRKVTLKTIIKDQSPQACCCQRQNRTKMQRALEKNYGFLKTLWNRNTFIRAQAKISRRTGRSWEAHLEQDKATQTSDLVTVFPRTGVSMFKGRYQGGSGHHF